MPFPSVLTSDTAWASTSVQMRERGGRTNHRAAVGFKHWDDTPGNRFRWAGQEDESRYSRIYW